MVFIISISNLYAIKLRDSKKTMKYLTNSETFEYGGLILPINNPDSYRSYKIILKKTAEQMFAVLSHHRRVMSLRLDLHLFEYTGTNKLISRFLEKLKRHLLEQYSMDKVGYLWVREVEKAKSQHYHLLLLLDANKIYHPGKLIRWIEEKWTNRDRPKPFTPKNCYTHMKRGDELAIKEVFYRASYLAKERSKGHKAMCANDYSTSRIKHKSLISEL